MKNFLYLKFGLVVVIFFGVGVESSTAQQKQSRSANVSEQRTPEETAQRQATLMEFVDEHHPDLKRLLRLLEERKPGQYRKAIRSLSRQFDRLQTVKKRDPNKYEIALRYWKVQSRVEVLSARVALNGPEKFEEKLKELIRQKQEIRIELQKYELAKLEQRVEKIRENLRKTQGTMDREVERQFNSILNRSRRGNENDRRQPDRSATNPNSKDGR